MVHESNGSYYAVIFSSQRTEGDNGYNIMAEKMEQLASGQPGFLEWKVSGILQERVLRFLIGRA